MNIPSRTEFDKLTKDEKVSVLKSIISKLTQQECEQLYEELMKDDEIRKLAESLDEE